MDDQRDYEEEEFNRRILATGDGEIPEPVGAWPVAVILNVRAYTWQGAVSHAYNLIDGLENVDTTEVGHVAGGYVLNHNARQIQED